MIKFDLLQSCVLRHISCQDQTMSKSLNRLRTFLQNIVMLIVGGHYIPKSLLTQTSKEL